MLTHQKREAIAAQSSCARCCEAVEPDGVSAELLEIFGEKICLDCAEAVFNGDDREEAV
jgi:hypothetical protein